MTLHQKPFNEWMLKCNYSSNTYKISSIYFPIHYSIHSHQKVSENINLLFHYFESFYWQGPCVTWQLVDENGLFFYSVISHCIHFLKKLKIAQNNTGLGAWRASIKVVLSFRLLTIAQYARNKTTKTKSFAAAGDRTRVTRVTGGNTYHYTTTTSGASSVEMILVFFRYL